MTDVPPRPDIASFLVSSIHDMKNSLNVMASFLETALRQSAADRSPLRRDTAKALYQAQRIDDNLLQLMTLYRLDREAYPFDPAEHQTGEFCRELAERVASLAEQRDIALHLTCAEELFWWFDRELVFNAVLQALHNALIYSQRRIDLSCAVRDGMLEIRVEDDGPGYPPELLARADAIGRGDCRETGSTGLGLYFSGVVARLHENQGRRGHARLDNRSRLGGSAFVLCLP